MGRKLKQRRRTFTEVPRQGLTEESEGQAWGFLEADGTAGAKALRWESSGAGAGG